ncbi:MAG TPA: ABC transporter ATP-binding protein [Anaerolineales bacterium]|jgi:ABC-2 type transport system ATP-binding protein|nr:ABC transporter ATP-binding protein [Anaerolineales bacterium]
MANTVIDVDKLTKNFGDFVAVNQVSFEVNEKEVVGYLGPNGSGKTTTIRMLLGLLLPTAGKAHVLSWDIQREPEKVRRQVGYMSQKFALYDELTAWENLAFYAGVYGVSEEKYLHKVLDRLGLNGQEQEPAAALPVGYRQRLALATAIVHEPRLLFLDEPTSGVDPNARRTFWDLIYELAAEGITIFATTHYMDEAEYCQRVGIMRAGNLLAFDTPTQLKQAALDGSAWQVQVPDLLQGLSQIEGQAGVKRVGLAADSLRVITAKDVTREKMVTLLSKAGLKNAVVESAEPSLEDVFLSLAGR